MARFTHNGSRNFIVKTYAGNTQDLLINTIGGYQGARPLTGSQPVTFDIDADGAWTIHIEAINRSPSAAFAGRGDNVSGLFEPPGRGAWEITHNGRRNFIVKAHCAGGTDLVQNEIGPVNGSKVVTFDRGPCFWEVEADGEWSLRPRS